MEELTPDQCRALKGKGRKYRNQPVVTPDGRFDSKGEARRWEELKLLKKSGVIRELARQCRWPLHSPTGFRVVAHMVWDFSYIEAGRIVVEDFKGPKPTEAWALKRKFFLAEYPDVVVRVTKRGKR